MKKLFVYLSILVFVLTISSCKKDYKEIYPPFSYPNFSQFKAGSYWIYQRFNIDSSGTATPTNVYDSCYVEKDTIINNRTYIKSYRPNPYIPGMTTLLTRDSLHYIVDVNGQILFSSQDFQTLFHSSYVVVPPADTVCRINEKMADKNIPVLMPAGTFITSDFLKTYLMFPKWSTAGNPRFVHTRYSENIGIVMETFPFFVSNPNYIERRLVRYHIN